MFSSAVSLYAEDTQASWPFVDVSNFERRGHEAVTLSGALQIAIAPLVTTHQLKAWEFFAAANQDWIREGVEGDVYIPGIPQRLQSFVSVEDDFEEIHAEQSNDKSDEAIYYPLWQQTPAPQDTSAVNLDLLSLPVFNKAHEGVLATGKAVFSEVADLKWLYGRAGLDNVTLPCSFLLQPIRQAPGSHTAMYDDADPVGLVVAVLPWDSFVNKIPQVGNSGNYVVVRSTCGDVFTYYFDGETPVFLGMEDLHDLEYDIFERSAEISPNRTNVEKGCTFSVSVYPSKQFEENYRTSEPALYAVFAAAGFILAVIVFAVYDLFVQRRHVSLMAAANRSNAIVSSFFPKGIRDRVLNDRNEQQEDSPLWSGFSRAPRAQIKSYLDDEQSGDTFVHLSGSKPLAELFPDVTIMFGDIAGFTAWSSVREPAQVFMLLESVYAEFDEIARKRRVFKVSNEFVSCFIRA